MEKFGGLLGMPYAYTENKDEIHKNVTKHLEDSFAIDFEKEGFLFCVWNDRMPVGSFYITATKKRIISRHANSIQQNFTADIQNAEKTAAGNIDIKTASDKTSLFHFAARPNKELLTKLFKKLNGILLDTK